MEDDEQFTWSVHDGVAVVRARGELDLHNADRLRNCCQEAIEALGPCVAVDLTNTTFMDSTALGVFVKLAKQTKAEGGWLRLVTGNSAAVQKMLKLTALEGVLGSYANLGLARRGRGLPG